MANNKGKASADALQRDLVDALIEAGYDPDFEEERFEFARPDLADPKGKLFVSLTSTLAGNRSQDLLEMATVPVPQLFVFIATEQLICPSMKQRADGKVLNLLNQKIQRMIGTLKPERVVAIYKDAAYSPAPHEVTDRSLLEPRMIWAPATDANAKAMFEAFETHSKRLLTKRQPASV